MNVSQRFFHIPLMLLAIIIGWGTISCSAGPSTTRYLVNEPERTVGLEVTYREGSPEYSHPASLTTEQVEKILQHIEVQPSSLLDRIVGGSATTQQAFSDEQRDFFSLPLSKAFSQATSLETITFYWANPRGNGIWEITSGGMYLQEHDVHLVLPNYRHTIPAKAPPQIPRTHPLTQLGEPLYSLKGINPIRQLTHSLATEIWAPQTPHFVVPLQALSQAQLPSNRPLEQIPHSLEETSESIRQRLKNIEELRNEGLLTEKEYQHKRQEILEKL